MRILTNPRGSWARYRGSVRLPRLGVGLVATAGALALGLAAIGPVSAHTAQLSNTTSSTGSAYTAMTPMRLLDTRTTGQTLGAGSSLNLPVVTAADGVPSNATAVALNVTVTNTTGASYLSAYPTGGTQPLVSNLNWAMGETVPNSVIVPVGTGGDVTFYNHTGSTDVVVDLEGYFAPPTNGSTAGAYVPLTPARIADTRTGSGYPNAGSTLAAGGSVNVQVTGAGGVPSGATAAILNVTATNTTAASYAEVYPTGATQPTASNLNWTMGETVANRVVAPLSASGMVTIYNHTGSTDVVVDVSGYFTNSTMTLPSTASLYNSMTPIRVVDTRVSGGTLGAGGTYTTTLGGAGSVPATATAVVTNVTAVNTTAASFFTVYPAGAAQPVASDVNWSAGQVVPNLTVATLSSTGAITVFNHAGMADLVIDEFGYFTPYVTPIVVVTTTKTTLTESTTATVTATVTDTSFTYPDPVQFTVTGAGCGTVSPAITSTALVNGANTASTTYTAGTTVGNCVITATEADGGNQGSISIATTAPTNTVTMSPASQTAVVSSGGFTITATVDSPTGAAVSGDAVTFTEVGNASSAACGSLNTTSGTTNSSGQVTVFYTPSATAGFCTVTATEAGTGATGTSTIDQTSLTSGAITVAVTSSPTMVDANGTSTSTITVTTTSSIGAYPNDAIMLSTPSSNLACGTLAATSLVTGSAGTATTTYTSSTGTGSTGTCQITAKEAAAGDSSPVGVNTALFAGPLSTSGPIAAIGVAPGVQAAIPSGSLVDVVSGTHTQQFTTSSATSLNSNVIDVVSATPNYAYPVGSLVVADGSSVIVQPTPAVPANTISLSPSTFSAVAGSGNSVVVTVTVTNASGVVSGDVLTYAHTGTCGALSAAGGTTGTNGQTDFGYTTASTVGFCTVTVTDGSGGSATFNATATS